MSIDKRYLKSLFEEQFVVEARIAELNKVAHYTGCEKCGMSSQDEHNAEIQGLLCADTVAETAINNYLKHHEGAK